MEAIQEIRKALEKGKAVLGTEETLKVLRAGTASKVFLSLNCPDNVRTEIQRFNTPVETINYPNDELGTACKKPFPISVIALKN